MGNILDRLFKIKNINNQKQRDDSLKELHTKLWNYNFVSVTGGSGSGKTYLVLEYVEKYKN